MITNKKIRILATVVLVISTAWASLKNEPFVIGPLGDISIYLIVLSVISIYGLNLFEPSKKKIYKTIYIIAMCLWTLIIVSGIITSLIYS